MPTKNVCQSPSVMTQQKRSGLKVTTLTEKQNVKIMLRFGDKNIFTCEGGQLFWKSGHYEIQFMLAKRIAL